MGKASIEDTIVDHPKFDGIGGDTGWFWLAGLLWSRRTLTDGFIPTSRLTSLVSGDRRGASHAKILVDRRLWEVVTGGYQIHDFLDHNPSKAQVRAYQEKDRRRKQHRHGFQPDSRSESTQESMADSAGTRLTRAKSESTSESESGLSAPRKESARETAVAVRHPRDQYAPSLIARGEERQHSAHAHCFPERGLCVTTWVHRELVGKRGGPAYEAEIRLWYEATMSELGDVPVGDAPDDFWRNKFAERWPPVTSKAGRTPQGKGHETHAGLSEALAWRRQP